MAGPPPRNGICVMSTPAISLNSSPASCDDVPLPADAMLIFPGLALPYATSSFTDLTPSEGETISAWTTAIACREQFARNGSRSKTICH